MEKKVIVLGGIGNTDRQNRDDFRVISKQGIMYTLKSHIDKDHPLTIKHLTMVKTEKTTSKAKQSKAKQSRIIGQMDNTIDHTFESANRVYDKRASAPTIPTCAGGGLQPKVIRKWT